MIAQARPADRPARARADLPACLVVLVAGTAPALVALDVAPLLRVPVALLLVCLLPGLALVRLVDVEDLLTTAVLAVAVTLALDIAVSLPLLYLNVWSPVWCLTALSAVAVAATLVRLVRKGMSWT